MVRARPRTAHGGLGRQHGAHGLRFEPSPLPAKQHSGAMPDLSFGYNAKLGASEVTQLIERCIANFLSELFSEEALEPLQKKTLFKKTKQLWDTTRLFTVLNTAHELIKSGEYVTQRALYYSNPKIFGSQAVSDKYIRTACKLLGVSRHSLHIFPSANGLILGDLTVWVSPPGQEAQAFAYSSQSAKGIDPRLTCITRLQTRAAAVLVVEKETIFQRVCQSPPDDTIVVTGRGQPDAATRCLVARLGEAGLPIFAAADCDAYGAAILHTYAFGEEETLSHCPLSCPSLVPIALTARDARALHVPDEAWLPADAAREIAIAGKIPERIEESARRAGGAHAGVCLEAWAEVGKSMEEVVARRRKCELEALDFMGFQYFVRTFIPAKIDEWRERAEECARRWELARVQGSGLML